MAICSGFPTRAIFRLVFEWISDENVSPLYVHASRVLITHVVGWFEHERPLFFPSSSVPTSSQILPLFFIFFQPRGREPSRTRHQYRNDGRGRKSLLSPSASAIACIVVSLPCFEIIWCVQSCGSSEEKRFSPERILVLWSYSRKFWRAAPTSVSGLVVVRALRPTLSSTFSYSYSG